VRLVLQTLDDSKGSLSHEKEQGGEKNPQTKKKRLGKDNMSSQDMISPVFGKRLVPANTNFTS